MKNRCITLVAVLGALTLSVNSGDVRAQGSIFGEVRNADLSFPNDGEISFIGFLNNSDDEIRIESAVGAGYEGGHWFDDFQNYQNAAPGIPYRYLFFNNSSLEGAVLAKTVPINSFQQEDVSLSPTSWPASPSPISVTQLSGYRVRIKWSNQAGVEYHIYRREAPSSGSFYRIDDTLGVLSAGVTDTIFIDSTVSLFASYDYMVASVSLSGDFSSHSGLASIEIVETCCVLRGDVNHSGGRDISDLTYLVEYLWGGGPVPLCPSEGDVNGSGGIDVSDVSYFVDYLFGGGSDPADCP